jgi:uridine kinase
LFLHQDQLADRWDFSIYLDVPFEVTAKRMTAARDGTNPDPHHPSMRRYADAQRIYFSACAPKTRATVVIDNADLESPWLVVAGADRRPPNRAIFLDHQEAPAIQRRSCPRAP